MAETMRRKPTPILKWQIQRRIQDAGKNKRGLRECYCRWSGARKTHKDTDNFLSR
jgi:hypothetical protein